MDQRALEVAAKGQLGLVVAHQLSDKADPEGRVHDDLLATGGTAAAATRMVRQAGGSVVGLGFVIELTFLKGRDRIAGYDVFSLLQYDK